jgi:hypothetical protein
MRELQHSPWGVADSVLAAFELCWLVVGACFVFTQPQCAASAPRVYVMTLVALAVRFLYFGTGITAGVCLACEDVRERKRSRDAPPAADLSGLDPSLFVAHPRLRQRPQRGGDVGGSEGPAPPATEYSRLVRGTGENSAFYATFRPDQL